jgi:hypothetical protein
MYPKLALLLLSTLLFSCSTDFDLTTGGEEKTVMYGLLNETDVEHYIRVEKMFVDEDIPPRELAKEESEVYHNNITVTLTKNNNQTFTLNRIDATDRGLPRDSGLLLSDPNYVYQIFQDDVNLTSGDSVLVRVLNEETVLAQAGASMVGPVDITRPRSDLPISILPGRSFAINWSDGDNASFYDVLIRFFINERKDGEENTIVLDWVAATGLDDSFYDLNGDRMYNFFAAELEPDFTTVRRVERVDIQINSGGEALKTFLDIQNLNTGITSSQVQPDFSNVENGLGVLSSRRISLMPNYFFSQITIDSLQSNRNTEALNFR